LTSFNLGMGIQGKEKAMSVETARKAAQYLSFRLGEETFALDITKVREILEFASVTKVPRMPPYMRGVINLRGNVVPVMDMRMRFGMTMTEKSINTCVIITEIPSDGNYVVIGTLADSVQEVIELDEEEIEPSPSIGSQVNTDFLKGMGKHDNDFIQIVEIGNVFSDKTEMFP